MPSNLTTAKHLPLSAQAQARIERFVQPFPAYGSPSMKTMVRIFILQHYATSGTLPSDRRQLVFTEAHSGFVGQVIDFSEL